MPSPQPAEGRRKRLLVADMDSTIVTGETLDEIAAYAGLKERIAEITRRAMNGELDFRTALIERVGMLDGPAVAALERTWEATRMTAGRRGAGRARCGRTARICALVSGGFTFFTGRVAERLGFHAHLLQHPADGRMASSPAGSAEPILDRDAKLATLKRLAAEQALPLAAALAVGDGANDLTMIRAAGLGVAFRAKPVVAAAARARVDHADLRGAAVRAGLPARRRSWRAETGRAEAGPAEAGRASTVLCAGAQRK